MAKKINTSRRETQSDSIQGESAIEELKDQFEEASEAVARVVSRIPRSTLYWGLGAIAIGAASIGAYIYRDRLAELYETAAESFKGDEADTDFSETSVMNRSTTSTPDLTDLERH
jgi:rhamnose utilization protein RhaD (predicted bifunctional aldolase and dehydrogenase)